MSTRLLHVVCTPRGLASNTGRVSGALLEGLLEQEEDLTITTLDLFKADLLTVPMWNLGIRYALKYYIDAIVQPGYLFRYNEQGLPEGLVTGRKMICVTSRGGDYSTEPFKSFDFVENYLRTIFGFVGITDMRFFNVQPMDVSMDLRRTAQRAAIGEVREYAASGEWRSGPDAASLVPDLAGVKPARMAVA